jgi:hypothetical protein
MASSTCTRISRAVPGWRAESLLAVQSDAVLIGSRVEEIEDWDSVSRCRAENAAACSLISRLMRAVQNRCLLTAELGPGKLLLGFRSASQLVVT